MDIGLNIANGVRVRVGDSIEDLTNMMKAHNVDYTIPYSCNKEGKVDMIMFMEKCGVELNVTNNIIVFIKSNNNESNYVMQLGEGATPVAALQDIKANIAEAFSIEAKNIRIDKFDGGSLNSTLSIPVNDTEKVKIEMITGANQKVYMHSITLAE